MAANGEKVTRNFCFSTLQSNVRGLQDQCKEDADPDDLEFDYEALRKNWEEYLTSQGKIISRKRLHT